MGHAYSVIFFPFQSFHQFSMFALDRPLIPKYTRAKLDTSATASSSTATSRSSSGVSSQHETPINTTTTRIVSASSTGRPYATTDRRTSVASTGSGRAASVVSLSRNKRTNVVKKRTDPRAASTSRMPPRPQHSADSGIGGESVTSSSAPDDKYILPPRITSYAE